MAKKNRIPIPGDIAAEVLFQSDRTCCKCNIPGKQLQIHHIDENPANNDLENLSVLCFECHDETMQKGGFGRKLDAQQVTKYKSEWLKRVKSRKAKADEIASIRVVTGFIESDKSISDYFEIDNLKYKTHNDPELLKEYLDKIAVIHRAQLEIARKKWDSGITANMNQGNYEIIDFYESVLIELATFYPKGHFRGLHPKIYFNNTISARFVWHRLILEPFGVGTGGTMVSTRTGGAVIEDIKNMIVDMVNSLSWIYMIEGTLDLTEWEANWMKQ